MTQNTDNTCPQCGRPTAAGLLDLCPDCLLKAGLDAATMEGAGGGAAFSPPTVAELAPLFPDLEIIEPLGRGGMGVVYKARQKRLDRLVALKILSPNATGRAANFGERFEREAQALARLGHPNIVAVYDSGQTGGIYYFIMEYVEGLNLRQLLRDGRLAAAQALAVVPQICDALQFAHDHGVVHRDIKPENILIDKGGRVKIADFGLAKILQRQPGGMALTAEGVRLGTPHYMAPEQTERPMLVDHRADIYSLGVVLYEMLTGELPLGRFPPPSRRVAVDVRIDEVVLKALEKEPCRRYQQASQVEVDMQEIAANPGPVPAGATTAPPVLHRGCEYKSRATLFGWPLLHFAFGMDPATGRPRAARGIVAIGERATGVIALGGFAAGIFAFGGLAVGVCAWGGTGLGLLAFGGLALALAIAIGGCAVGPVAFGGWALGWYGTAAAGHCRYWAGSDPEAAFLIGWLRGFRVSPETAILLPIVWAIALGAVIFWARWVASRAVAGRRLNAVAPWLPGAAIVLVASAISFAQCRQAYRPVLQEVVADLQPDGVIRARTTMEIRNGSARAMPEIQFCNSDFVRIDTVRAADGAELPFKSEHGDAVFTYRVALPQPLFPGKTIRLVTEGTETGLIEPAAEPNTFTYRMDHSPGTITATRRVEIHRLPPGAELVGKSPEDLKHGISADGRIELRLDRLIPKGGHLLVNYTYRLPKSGGESSDAAFAAACAEKAGRLVRDCRDGEFGRATADFAKVMSDALPASKVKELFEKLGGVGGKITGIGPARAESIPGFLLVYIPVRWERNALDLKIVFDGEGKVSGLWTMPPGSKQAGAKALPLPAPAAPGLPAEAAAPAVEPARGEHLQE